jgi:L,D-transpeptidase ErfK/SrfK
VKIGQRNGQVYVEAHPDVYRRIPDYNAYALQKLDLHPLNARVDRKKFMMAIMLQSGVPIDVTLFPFEDSPLKLVESIR